MSKIKYVDEFLSLRDIALIGVSNKKEHFSQVILKTLKSKGKNLYLVNPKYDEINGEKCYRTLNDLPKNVNAAIILTSKKNTDEIINQIIDKNFEYIWIQQGSETENAISIAKKSNVKLISKRCILMYAEPVEGFHKFHKNISKLFGKF